MHCNGVKVFSDIDVWKVTYGYRYPEIFSINSRYSHLKIKKKKPENVDGYPEC